jgi:chromosomal replication initiator protein
MLSPKTGRASGSEQAATEEELPLESASPSRLWETALGRLQLQVTRPNYDTWLKDTVGLRFDEGRLIVGAPGDFHTEWLHTRLRPLIGNVLTTLTGQALDVGFEVLGARGLDQEPVAAIGRGLPDSAKPSWPRPRLNAVFTFDSFVVGSCNRLAHAAAMAVASAPGQPYNPLLICGPTGLGKTHLLHAIAHEAIRIDLHVVCASAEQFTSDFVTAVRDQRTDEFRRRYRGPDLLLLDDVQFLQGKDQTQIEFYHAFDELHTSGRQIALTCDRCPQDLTSLDLRLRSRLQGGLIADIKPPSLHTRMAILHSKAGGQGLSIGTDVLEFLASRLPDNVRELEGSLTRVAAYARLTQQALTVQLAAAALEDVTSDLPPPLPTPESIVTAVCRHFSVSRQLLTSRSRDRQLAYARQIAMYLLREEAHRPLTEIGRVLGGRDHATVLHGCSKISKELALLPDTRDHIECLRRTLRNQTAA